MTSNPTPELEKIVHARWGKLIPIIDRLVERAQTSGEWRTNPKSPLAVDDIRTSPYQTSHAFQMLLNAAIDNLNGIRHLIFGRPDEPFRQVVLLQATHFVLARCAIENLATALWILGPENRSQRVERTLRWHVRNVSDQHSALDRFGGSGRTKRAKLEDLEDIMRAATGTVPDTFRKGYWSETVVKYADTYEELTGQALSNLVLWQLCSGFAHGRPWSSLTFLDRELKDTADADVLEIRMTSDMTRALAAPNRAVELCATLLRRHQQLNTAMLH